MNKLSLNFAKYMDIKKVVCEYKKEKKFSLLLFFLHIPELLHKERPLLSLCGFVDVSPYQPIPLLFFSFIFGITSFLYNI